MSETNQNPGILVPPIGTCHDRVRQALQDIIRRLGTSATPSFGSLTLNNLTAVRLVHADADKKLTSADIVDYVDGTTNQITITDNGDGTITLALPQDIHAGASPEFVTATLSGATALRLLATDADQALVSTDLGSWLLEGEGVTLTDGGDGTVTIAAEAGAASSVSSLTFDTVDMLPDPAVDGQIVRLVTDQRLYYGKITV